MFQLAIADRIATLTLDRAPVNAMNDAWVSAFNALLDQLASRADVSVLHIRSALRVFSAGADLAQMRARFNDAGLEPQLASIRDYQRLFARIEALPLLTLAEIGGAALGGGCELTLACDLRIAAHEARLGLPELRLGLLPGAGGTQRLTRLCGRPLSLRLILGAETPDGATAERMGLVQWAVPLGELPARAREIATRYAALPAHAMRAAKSCIAAAATPGEAGFDAEIERTRMLLQSEPTRALVGAFLARSGTA
ncbi:MAG: enoyl-CoA hydratase/isomerase family protein [Rhodospirillales bacterium]|nr:enoyl-CoA hydratase/isomerase family protein [Rhodospirillales bacterium]